MISKGGALVEVGPLPIIGKMVCAVRLEQIVSYYDNRRTIIVIEKAQAFRGQGITSAFNYGVTNGIIIGVASCFCSYWLVPPKTWQREMLVGTSAELDSKERSRLAASRLFPEQGFTRTSRSKKMDDGLTDAALIAEYARRTYGDKV